MPIATDFDAVVASAEGHAKLVFVKLARARRLLAVVFETGATFGENIGQESSQRPGTEWSGADQVKDTARIELARARP